MKYGLTVSENLNLFKQLKSKKFNKSLPPISINKEESNLRDANLSAGEYYEDLNINDIREKNVPKIMKIIKKKNK